MRWSPESLANAARGRLIRAGSRPIATAFIDSRRPRVDGLFVPIAPPIATRDGHDFIAAARDAGASATLLAQGRPVPEGDLTVVEVEDTFAALNDLARAARSQISGPVVAITGSNGKTTTRAFVAAALATGFDRVACTRGNFNNHLGLPLTLLDAPEDPGAAVLELGMSAPGENDHLAAIAEPNVHVITSIALEHLEFMGSLEAIAAAEAEPIAHLRGGPCAPLLVLPGDEPALAPHVPGGDGVEVVRFGGPGSDVEILAVEVGERTRATIAVGGRRFSVALRTFGAHNARNAAAALAVGHHLGLDLEAVVDALDSVEPVGDRGRLGEWGGHLVISDCYNANPGSMMAAIDSLALLRGERPGRLIAVLGDMLELGPDSSQLHAEIGRYLAARGIDAVLGVGPLARVIVDAAAEGGVVGQVCGVDAVEDAAAWVREWLGDDPGAVLFKASRGIALERVVERL